MDHVGLRVRIRRPLNVGHELTPATNPTTTTTTPTTTATTTTTTTINTITATAASAVSAVGGDALFNCPNRELARTMVEHGSRVFVYEFQDAPQCWTPSYPYINDNLRQLSVFHERSALNSNS